MNVKCIDIVVLIFRFLPVFSKETARNKINQLGPVLCDFRTNHRNAQKRSDLLRVLSAVNNERLSECVKNSTTFEWLFCG